MVVDTYTMLGLKLATKFREKRNCDWWVFLNVKTITGSYATDFGVLSWRVQPLLTKVRFGDDEEVDLYDLHT